LPAASSRAWRDQAATSPACQSTRLILLPSDSNSCREVVPGLGRLAILANVGNPASVLDMREVQAAARTLGLEADIVEIRRAEDIAPRSNRKGVGRSDTLCEPSVHCPALNVQVAPPPDFCLIWTGSIVHSRFVTLSMIEPAAPPDMAPAIARVP